MRRACEVQAEALNRQLQGAHVVAFRGKLAQLGNWSSGSCDCSTAIGDSSVVSPRCPLAGAAGAEIPVAGRSVNYHKLIERHTFPATAGIRKGLVIVDMQEAW